MPRTITVRVSIVLGLGLLMIGSGVFAYGAYEGAAHTGGKGINVDPLASSTDTEADATISAMPPDQRGLFLLAVSSETGMFTTTSEQLQATISEMPDTVRYEGDVYQVLQVVIDGAPGADLQVTGIGLVAVGILTLAGAVVSSVMRRFRT